MNEEFDIVADAAMEGQEQGFGLLEKLFDVARPGAVYGEPVEAANRTVITASEVVAGVGVGFGFGGGSSSDPVAGPEEEDTGAQQELDIGVGGGGGGCGGAKGRPVAIVSVTDEGVHVQPVVDVTKIALAFLTAWGSMLFMLSRMRRGAEG